MEKNLNEIRRIACITNNKTALDLTLGKPYNINKLENIILETEYVILGKGIIKKDILESLSFDKSLLKLTNNFIFIRCNDDLVELEKSIQEEEARSIEQEKASEEEWKNTLKEKIATLSLSKEEKEKIFELILNCSTNKKEMGNSYQEVYNILKYGQGTKELFNLKPGIKLNKNDFPQNKIKGEE